jgi:hypothetical protein
LAGIAHAAVVSRTLRDPLAHRIATAVVADDLIHRIHRRAAGQVAYDACMPATERIRASGGRSHHRENRGSSEDGEECFHRSMEPKKIPLPVTRPREGYSEGFTKNGFFAIFGDGAQTSGRIGVEWSWWRHSF